MRLVGGGYRLRNDLSLSTATALRPYLRTSCRRRFSNGRYVRGPDIANPVVSTSYTEGRPRGRVSRAAAHCDRHTGAG